VRLHGLKVWCEKCVPILPLVQRAGPTCGEEGRVRHAEKTKNGPQIRLHEIERGHPLLGVVDPTRCDDEGCLLAGDQALRQFAYARADSQDSGGKLIGNELSQKAGLSQQR
jgi:hypothetical protein